MARKHIASEQAGKFEQQITFNGDDNDNVSDNGDDTDNGERMRRMRCEDEAQHKTISVPVHHFALFFDLVSCHIQMWLLCGVHRTA